MDSDRFVTEISKYKKKTRRLILNEGDPGQVPITKIGGVPWWPKNTNRPRCKKGSHPMTFMAQILMSDVPEFGEEDTLLSFHYCEQCSYEGNMSFGWTDSLNRGYNLSFFSNLQNTAVDDLGIIAEPTIEAYNVQFSDAIEVPSIDDMPYGLQELIPDDYLEYLQDDFDENVYPGLIHVSKSKVGGWPSWVQSAEWPKYGNNANMIFVCQLDWVLGAKTSWGGGGYAYILASPPICTVRSAELVIQTT